jgi:hypothetical protein
MACPLFLPVSPLTGFPPEATTLGDLYGGECAADVGALIPAATLRACCNAGYARGTCERAARSDADAVRFLIKLNTLDLNTNDLNTNDVIDVAWSIERNHHPVAVGTTQVSNGQTGGTEPLDRQIQAYVAAYLRQKPRS